MKERKTLSLGELIKLGEEDSTFEMLGIEQSLNTNSNKISKWISLAAIEGSKHRELIVAKEAVYSDRYKFYRWESEYDCVRAEIETLIKGEPEYKAMLTQINISKEKLTLIESTIKNLTGLGFNIKNIIEWEKLKGGI
jgi:hypothetical protein